MSRSMRLRGAYAGLNGVYWMLCCLNSFTASFLLGRGYSNSELGAVMAAGYVLGLALQQPAASLADRTARSPLAVIAAGTGLVGAAAAVLLALPGRSFAVTAVYVLFFAFIILLQPLVNGFAFFIERLGTTVPFGICRAVGSLGYGLLAAVLGRVVQRSGVNAVPLAGLLTALVMLGLMGWFSRAGTPPEAAAEKSAGPAAGSGSVLRDRRFRMMLLATALLFFSHSFLSVYMLQIVQNVGGNNEDMGLMTAFVAVLELPTMFLFDRLLRRVTCGGLLRFSAVFFAVKTTLVLAAGSLPAVYGGMFFQIFAYALFIPASVRYAGQISGPENANRAQAWVTVMTTVGSVCASGLGGVMIDRLGLKAALALAAICAAAGAAVMVLGVRERNRAETGS